MDTKIFCIFGKQGSGKTYLSQILIGMGMNKIEECTTRPRRPGETYGREYQFLTEADINGPEVICQKIYDMTAGNWTYGLKKMALNKNEKYVVILNPYQYKEFLHYYQRQADIIPIYMISDEATRFMKVIGREERKKKPDYFEICRRYREDEHDFSEKHLKKCGILEPVILFNGFDQAINEIAMELLHELCIGREEI